MYDFSFSGQLTAEPQAEVCFQKPDCLVALSGAQALDQRRAVDQHALTSCMTRCQTGSGRSGASMTTAPRISRPFSVTG